MMAVNPESLDFFFLISQNEISSNIRLVSARNKDRIRACLI